MINVSNEFIQLISRNTRVEVKGTLTLADGTVRQLAGDDLMMGTTSFSDATSSSSSFDIGAAIIGQCHLTLNNYDGRFDDYDFTDAEITPYVGVRLSGGTVEWIRKGQYTVDQPDTYGTTIGLTCLDHMSRFERPYGDVTTRYPATLQTIVTDMAIVCGVTLDSGTFPNCEYVVRERPDDQSLTCLAMLAYAAQVAGCFARMTNVGTLSVTWYDTAAFEGEDWLDGETFDDGTPYQSGDDADGGNFTNYASGDSHDGGSFARRPWVNLYAYASMAVVTDDVVITGVSVTAQDDKPVEDGGTGRDGETTLFGTSGYVLSLDDNPLVAFGRSAEVARQVGERVVGMRFRPFDMSALGDPSVEAGDPVVITDRCQNSYVSYITSLTYKVNAYASVACDAETPGRHTAKSFSAMTKAIVDARNAVKRERTARELAVAHLATELAEASGLYSTEVEQPDGSVIYYMHDKSTLAESAIVWKMTAEAVGISTDGGETYPYGLDVGGTAILNRIYAIGIDAGYVNAGALRIGPAQNPLMLADFDAGTFYLNTAAMLGSRTVQQVIDGVDATITDVDVEYAQGTSPTTAPASGWSTTSPAWESGKYIWQRTTTTTGTGGSAVTTHSTPVMISGRDGADGTNGRDGTSVAITSASKSGDTTTVVITDGSTTSTLTIVDGQDGSNGTNGANGYVHTAWANSADGTTDFSTTASANKQYLGVYTDNTAADSTSPGDYSWSLIKGADGADGRDGTDGDDGVGITSISEQYYLSTSDQTQTGGSWSDAQPTWSSGKYIWTRSAITWDTTPATTTYTTPMLANALNQLNSDVASNAQAIVTETQNRTSAQAALAAELGVFHDDLAADIAEARRYATDYLAFNNGELTIGVANNAVKNVLRADSQVYRTNAGDIAGYGLFGGIWEMFIETARIQNMLRFGDFAWIARQNGNMTLKWTGA